MLAFICLLSARVRREEAFSTAELLGNAALGIAALIAIWGLLHSLGVDVIAYIQQQLLTTSF
jgi:hypothetical protein